MSKEKEAEYNLLVKELRIAYWSKHHTLPKNSILLKAQRGVTI